MINNYAFKINIFMYVSVLLFLFGFEFYNCFTIKLKTIMNK